MDEDYEYWDKDDADYDSDNEVAVSPTVDSEVVFEEEEHEEKFEDKEMKEKISPPIMFEYEKSNILYKRKEQLDNNKPSTMEDYVLKNGITSSFDIAMLEFDNGKLPDFYIIRKFDKGYYEKWHYRDFIYFPK